MTGAGGQVGRGEGDRWEHSTAGLVGGARYLRV